MSIQTIIDNLTRTINGKIKLMEKLPIESPLRDVIRSNVDELIHIRYDLIEVRDGSS